MNHARIWSRWYLKYMEWNKAVTILLDYSTSLSDSFVSIRTVTRWIFERLTCVRHAIWSTLILLKPQPPGGWMIDHGWWMMQQVSRPADHPYVKWILLRIHSTIINHRGVWWLSGGNHLYNPVRGWRSWSQFDWKGACDTSWGCINVAKRTLTITRTLRLQQRRTSSSRSRTRGTKQQRS